MSNIFFSYSHQDEPERNRLEQHLAVLISDGTITTWHDRKIKAGEVFDEQIDSSLELADIILLLLSASFLSSQYCYSIEMKRALERRAAGEAQVVPVILRHCDWHNSPLGKLLAIPKDGKPIISWSDHDEAYLDVVRQIRRLLQSKTSAQLTKPQTSSLQRSNLVTPRSGNLRMSKTFSERDKDTFLEDGFTYMAGFFENSLNELTQQHSDVETKFRQIDANRFTAKIYRSDVTSAKCKISIGGHGQKSITYSNDDSLHEDAYNEELRVKSNDEAVFFEPLVLASSGTLHSKTLSHEDAAEYYWSLLMRWLK